MRIVVVNGYKFIQRAEESEWVTVKVSELQAGVPAGVYSLQGAKRVSGPTPKAVALHSDPEKSSHYGLEDGQLVTWEVDR